MLPEQPYLLGDLLKDVSRSFYLTLRILPGKIRFQIGLAYLLARTTDTVADTELVPVERRLEILGALRQRISGKDGSSIEVGDLAGKQGSRAERVLLEKWKESLSLLDTLESADLTLVRAVLETITSGQELDLRRFAGASVKNILCLKSAEELEDYTYRVAGCVGEFWTRMCRRHLFPRARFDDAWLLANGVRFGKGLQLTNILRDVATDLRNGRCYLPLEELSPSHLKAEDLLDPANESRVRPVYDKWLGQALLHLRAGWAYTNALPRRSVRVRLACAWPVLIGLETLKRLRKSKVLEPDAPIKISRGEVKRIILRTILLYPSAALWKNLAPETGDFRELPGTVAMH